MANAASRGRGGVWVMHTPYLLFYPDRDRDESRRHGCPRDAEMGRELTGPGRVEEEDPIQGQPRPHPH